MICVRSVRFLAGPNPNILAVNMIEMCSEFMQQMLWQMRKLSTNMSMAHDDTCPCFVTPGSCSMFLIWYEFLPVWRKRPRDLA